MYSLEKFVTKIISPLTGQTVAHVKDSHDFRNMILKERIDESEIIVSFDVKTLYTNVPIDKTLEVIGNKLINDQSLEERSVLSPEQITKLVEVCLKITYFVYNSEYYEQLEGAAMGSPVSPIVVNIFMEHFEEIVLDSRFRLWRRYVDDVFCIIKRSNVETALVYLNSLFPSITFTVYKEQDGSLPFMDILVSRLVDGSMMTSVYRKPAHTDCCLSYNSNHPPHVKRGVIKSLLNRARDISAQSTLGSEIEPVMNCT